MGDVVEFRGKPVTPDDARHDAVQRGYFRSVALSAVRQTTVGVLHRLEREFLTGVANGDLRVSHVRLAEAVGEWPGWRMSAGLVPACVREAEALGLLVVECRGDRGAANAYRLTHLPAFGKPATDEWLVWNERGEEVARQAADHARKSKPTPISDTELVRLRDIPAAFGNEGLWSVSMWKSWGCFSVCVMRGRPGEWAWYIYRGDPRQPDKVEVERSQRRFPTRHEARDDAWLALVAAGAHGMERL
jgi:hypothetical protein